MYFWIRGISILRHFVDSLTLVFVSNKLMSSLYKSNIVFVQVKYCLYRKSNNVFVQVNVVFVLVKCCLCTSQMLSLYNVVQLQVKCNFCTSQMPSLNKSIVVFFLQKFNSFLLLLRIYGRFRPCFPL